MVEDSLGNVHSETLMLTFLGRDIQRPPALALSAPRFPDSQIGSISGGKLTFLDAATGGAPPYSYTLTCNPLSLGVLGLSLVHGTSKPELEGDALDKAGATWCTYSATDSAGSTVYLTPQLWTIKNVTNGLTMSVPASTYVFRASTTHPFPAASGGPAGTIAYTLSGCPTGMTVAGTQTAPTVAAPSDISSLIGTQRTCTWTATKGSGGSQQSYAVPVVVRFAAATATQGANPVHDALLPDHGRRASTGTSAAVARSVSAWARLPLAASPADLTPTVSAESFGGRLDGFAISGSTRAVDVTAVLPAGTDWLLGVNARSVETTSTYDAYAVHLNQQGYYRGDYDSELLSVTPFVATRLPGGAHAYAAAGVGYGTMRHRDVDSGKHTNGRDWAQWNHAPLDLRTWHLGGGLPLGDAGPGLLAFAARVDGFTIEAEPNAVMRPVADRGRPYRYSGSTWTAGADWTHQSRWRPSLHVDWEHDTGDGTEGSRLVVGAAIDAAGIVHPRLALELDARHVRDVNADADDGWRVRGGLRWSAAPSGHGVSADLGTTVRTEDDGTVATLGGELRWRGVPAASLGSIEPYGGFEQFVSGSTRHRLGVRLPRSDDRTIGAEAWQEPEVDDFGVRLVFRSAL